MSRIVAVIQARSGSKRLPDKVLLKLEGKTVLEHVIARVKKSRLIDEAVVATTTLKEDRKIANLCENIGTRFYCGSENDCLDRFYQAAVLFNAGQIVRITADCPFMDASVIDKVIRLHLKSNSDYASNTAKVTFPDGEDVEVFKFKALETAWKEAKLSSEREHVTPYIKKHPDLFKIVNLENIKDLSQKRWTLDEKNDYKFVKEVYARLYKKNHFFGMEEILKLLDKHPELERINAQIKRNEGYTKSLKEDKVLDLNYLVK